MCIRDRDRLNAAVPAGEDCDYARFVESVDALVMGRASFDTVSYTHLRAHETVLDLVCRLLLEKKKITLLFAANVQLLLADLSNADVT